MKALRKFFESEIGPRSRIALVGAVNVGKSALIRALLPKGSSGPTTSTLPATTQHVVSHSLGRDGLTILDTPGVIPGHRIPDLLCPQCAAALVPRKRLRSKLVHMGGGKGVLFGGLAAVRCDDESLPEIVTLAFTSENVPLHYTRAARVIELLQGEGKHWLHTDCPRLPQPLGRGRLGGRAVHGERDGGARNTGPRLGLASRRRTARHRHGARRRPRQAASSPDRQQDPSRSAAPRKRTGFKSKR